MAKDNEASSGPRALQLVTLDMEAKKVDVNTEALEVLDANLKALGANKVAIVSVMGAFRGGKSFLLDLFLRKLRYDRKNSGNGTADNSARDEAPERGQGKAFPTPKWIVDAGHQIEGGSDKDDIGGFRFKGGMDHCTEGIWAWSEPFLRKVEGESVALILMDTQGAWDGNMTKEQSATIFGLTALLSSKQIYNVSQQIQEDKVENLAYFMSFAREALRHAYNHEGNHQGVDTPFQALDFLVRDWANFEDEWTLDQCKEQMREHLNKHLNPSKVVENSTAEALQTMFQKIDCFCFPHPGLKINKAAWTGVVDDIDEDFVRFLDEYIHNVFSKDLKVKTVLGSELTTTTFPIVFKGFVKAFQAAAPQAMSLQEAMKKATVLLAKERVLGSYAQKMDEKLDTAPSGLKEEDFEEWHRQLSKDLESEYSEITILGTDETRGEAWDTIVGNINALYKRYHEENIRRLEKALVVCGPFAAAALILFLLDRVSDFTCDWWSQTCQDMSRMMMMVYTILIGYIGFKVWQLNQDRGRMAMVNAVAELWKEVVRLMTIYWDHLQEKMGAKPASKKD